MPLWERGGAPGPPGVDENDSRAYHFTIGVGPILSSTAGVVFPPGKKDSYPDGFIRQLSQKHNVPEEEIRQAKEKHGLSDGDTYMATALARRTNRRVGDVAAEYKQNQGKGWGVMAMNMGIKPGSPEFKELKANARGSVKHM